MRVKQTLLTMSLTLISVAFAGNAAWALTEQSEAALEFTFAPSLTLSVSDSDIIIDNLMPGTSGLSNTVDVTVTTNNIFGYILSATTGNTTYPTRNLVRDSSNFLEGIAVNSSTTTLGNDTWGYTLDNGSTYSGLPLYTSAGVELNSSEGPVNAVAGKTSFAIGAKASANKAAGNYTNVVNFTAVSRVIPTIQSITTATCPTTRTPVYDSRDGQRYYIQKITTGETTLCWMTKNLNIAGGTTLTPEESNVASNYTLPDSSTAGFDDATKAFVYNDNTYGGYYSYVAATVGTNPSSGNADYDICPKGWRMPTNNEYTALANTYTTGSAITAAPWYGLYGGTYYQNSATNVGSYAYYLSSTARNSSEDFFMEFYGSSTIPGMSGDKRGGYSVRCVAK